VEGERRDGSSSARQEALWRYLVRHVDVAEVASAGICALRGALKILERTADEAWGCLAIVARGIMVVLKVDNKKVYACGSGGLILG